MRNAITFDKIVPTYLKVEYEENGKPYIYYEGIILSNDQIKKIIIPHLDLTLNNIYIEPRFDEVGTPKLILPFYNQIDVTCRLQNIGGEEVYFVMPDQHLEVEIDEPFDPEIFKW